MHNPFQALAGLHPQGQNQFDENDPLGIAVQQRGMAHRQEFEREHPGTSLYGPLADPKWEGFFQAAHEQGAGKFGYFNQPHEDASRGQVFQGLNDPNVTPDALQGLMNARSQQLGTPVDLDDNAMMKYKQQQRPSIAGLRR